MNYGKKKKTTTKKKKKKNETAPEYFGFGIPIPLFQQYSTETPKQDSIACGFTWR